MDAHSEQLDCCFSSNDVARGLLQSDMRIQSKPFEKCPQRARNGPLIELSSLVPARLK
jgi:hypothetical protein